MTTLNKELFTRDPTKTKIPNDGVAKVVRPETSQQWDVLEWELKSFVCEGEYERGLDRILSSFLANIGQAQQPAVWVSGFYGSGKSHLCRVLEYLWRDVELPSGESARSLANLPTEITAHLRELSTAAKRQGGLWSAAGTLGAGKSQAVRLAFLSVLFDAADLPTQYPLARFTIWAQDSGYLEAVIAAVETAGKEYRDEVQNLYVSPIIARALLKADSTLGESVRDVRSLLQTQFPARAEDITDEEMFEAVEDVLRMQSETPGKYPLTLVLLDEMQQYLGDDNEKTLAVQNIVEGVSSRFDNCVLFVTTGQSAMGGTPTLQKLTDRFPVHVHLSDKDVETVVREVVLRKKPDRCSELETVLDQASGEIDRHLGGTKIAPMAADKQDLVPDYPLLPTRRRFWELALRALDRAGKAGVLRTQLRIIHEAARKSANDPIGHVVGADFLYEQQSAALQQSGILLKEIDELIRGLAEEKPDGELKSRLCSLVFLISQIPSQMVGTGEIGLRATAPFIADMLVEDLQGGGVRLRKRVPELLEELVDAGRLMTVDGQYRLQTEEGAEWEKDYRGRLATIRDDPGKLATLRNERLHRVIDAALGGMKITQGKAKTPRRIELRFADDEPTGMESRVPVWLRDEWTVTESAVKKAAAQAGDDSPVVHVVLPKREAEVIKETLASYAAAQETVQSRPTPQTDEGKTAQRAMKGRVQADEERLASLFQDVVDGARVYQGGGHQIETTGLREAVQLAAERSLFRMYPRFDVADNPNWGKVSTRARGGAPDALEAVGHVGTPQAHPVCKEMLATISAAGSKGSDIHKRFSEPPYGWGQDAIRGALLALLAAGHIRAARDGVNLTGPKQLEPRQIGKTTFYKEDEPPTVTQRMAVRGLLTAAGISHEPNQEQAQIPALLQKLQEVASHAGGGPPLPPCPDVGHIMELQALAGNQQFREVADAHDRLKQELEAWGAADRTRERRQHELSELERLLAHAGSLEVSSEVREQTDAIQAERRLLDEPDPVRPLIDALTEVLRSQLTGKAIQLADAHDSAIAELAGDESWQQLGEETRQAILGETGLVAVAKPDVSTDGALLTSLDDTPLFSWDERLRFVEARVEQARQAALRELEPDSVTVKTPSARIRGEKDLEKHLEEIRELVKPHIQKKKTVII